LTLGAIAWSIWMALTYFVDQPLQQLVQAMGRVEEGELGTRVHSRSTDELGRLTRHFNKMISKQESAQRDIERLHKEQMARADRLATIGAMAAAIAHEIRNPLTGIRGALSVLSRGLPDEDPRRLIVRETNLVIDRLNKSVEDILDYARPSLPQLQTIELGEVVDRTLSLLEGESREAGIELVKESVAGGGREDDKATVNVDPQQIQQVLVNLILNAMHATRAGGRIFIRTRPVTEGGRPNGACIEVEDHGEGMTSEAVEKAFQPFFTTKAKGTGLGLAIARQIVEQHHGRISLRSVRGEGTCSPSERT
jgi:two-component system NtrC family sensor kinase